MNTDIHINNVHREAEAQLPCSLKIRHWIHNHPTVLKTIKVALWTLGILAVTALPVTFPLIAFGAIAIAASFGATALAYTIGLKILDIAVPPKHHMRHHAFKPASFEAARLYYQGDIPILEIKSDDPRKAGAAHGYLMGKYLNTLFNRLNSVKGFSNLPSKEQVPKVIRSIQAKIPKEYLEEMQGLVEGYNRWVSEKKWFKPKQITLEDIILFHLMPDSIHFSPKQVEAGVSHSQPAVKPTFAAACTTVIDKDDKEGFVFGRNMDWPSLGLFGKYSLVINRQYTNGKQSLVEVGLPGFIGTLTGMNKQGLSLAMNVCIGQTKTIKGMPAALYNRMCLENSQTVGDVEQKINAQPPLGSYHLNVADPKGAKSFHLHQIAAGKHIVREKKENSPLITTNAGFDSRGEPALHMFYSKEREAVIKKLFTYAGERAKLVERSLKLPFVNNYETTHCMVMYPETKKIKIALDNAFAGDAKLLELNTAALF